ncbi:MAG: peptidoglycan DD-metalloendopeptidase family protein [Evtepia sp.]
MKNKKSQMTPQKMLVAVLAVVLALTMLIPLVVMVMPAQAAQTKDDLQSQISSLEKNSGSLKDRRKQLNAELSNIRNNKAQVLSAKQNLDEQMESIEEELANIQKKIAVYDGLIAEAQEELEAAKEKEKEQYILFCSRVRDMEETGTVSYWSIMFNSASFSEFLDNAMGVSEIMEYDNEVAAKLEAARVEVEKKEAGLQTQRRAQAAAKQEQEAAKNELDAKAAEAQKILKSLEADENATEDMLAKVAADEANVDQEIRSREKQIQALIVERQSQNQTQFVDSVSGFSYPLPSSYTRISSPFGTRTHPVTGRPNSHTGIDLPAPKNTRITAVKSGIVSISGYNSSYGNYVVIQHTGGYSSLYGHMNSRAVSVNATVQQGQVIGYVGTTGSSTGNHLHLEIRRSGSRINPTSCFPGVF